ncbi:MAG: lantibiotic dehydratase [Spirosomataceae bacterium]
MAIQFFDFYLLRRHLLPIDGLFCLNDTCPNVIEAEVFLRKVFSQKLLEEAVFIASPNLYQRFKSWLNGEVITEKSKLIQTLFKYYLRACSRCTPYGMFAGCAVGQFADETTIDFEENELNKYNRIDNNYLVEIVNTLLRNQSIRRQIKFYPNNTIYQINDKFHYLFYLIQDGKRSYSICSFENSEFVKIILRNAQKGILIDELINFITNEEISYEDAEQFINQLIDEQILISEIEPTITGNDFLSNLIQKLSKIRINDDVLDSLKEMRVLLNESENSIQNFQQIQSILNRLTGNSYQDILQTDLFFNTSTNTISNTIIKDLTKKMEALLVINHGNYLSNLEDFKKRFIERYETREIPLTLALDNEIGIGYGLFASDKPKSSAMLEDIKHNIEQPQNIVLNYWKQFTLNKYTEALRKQDFEITLTDKDLELLAQKHTEYNTKLPSNGYVFGAFYAEKDYSYTFELKSMAGPSALSLMGRFGNGNQNLHEKLKQCAEYESQQNEDVIYAEIVHLPDARIGNISSRPSYRDYEILYQTPSNLPTSNQILIEDLMVSASNEGEIILRSKRLNKRVIPRLSCAHNFENGLSIYNFLADLQTAHECLNVHWHWNIITKQTFLPRVRYQNIILSPAIWNLKIDDFDFKKSEVNITRLKEIQSQFKIPRYVTISEGDNELWMDFENEICLKILMELWQKNAQIKLKETFINPENSFLKTAKGNFLNEVIVPFKMTDYQAVKSVLKSNKENTKRLFSIGSEWVYFKIYCGELTADELLKNQIRVIVNDLYQDKIIDSFFFVRYQDPEPHLRLRFRGNPANFFYTHVIESVYESLNIFLENGVIHKIQIDTYKREIERYGAETMETSEAIFAADSLSVIDFIAQNKDENEYIQFAMRHINAYFENFELKLEDKLKFVEMMQKSFLSEFGDESNLRKSLNIKYRDFAKIDFDFYNDPFYIQSLARDIIIQNDNNMSKIFDLLSSYIHMFVNRLFYSNQRASELLIYHFLVKKYIPIRHLHLL